MNKWLEIGLYSAAAALVSGAASFYFTKKHMDKVHNAFVQEEVAQIKAHYHKVIEDSKATMRNEAEKEVIETMMTHLGYNSVEEAEAEVKVLENDALAEAEQETFVDPEDENTAPSDPRVSNIWDTPQLTREEYENGVGDDPEDETKLKSDEFIPHGTIQLEPDYPFTITAADYFEDEPEYDKLTVTYYVADNVLVDDRDEPIDDVEGTIGPDAIESFGHISGDPSICYVRNRSRDADFEIIKNDGAYAVDVLGMDPNEVKNQIEKSRENE